MSSIMQVCARGSKKIISHHFYCVKFLLVSNCYLPHTTGKTLPFRETLTLPIEFHDLSPAPGGVRKDDDLQNKSINTTFITLLSSLPQTPVDIGQSQGGEPTAGEVISARRAQLLG